MWYIVGIVFIVLAAFWWLRRAARAKPKVEAEPAPKYTQKYSKFLQFPFGEWADITDLPAVGDATGARLKNQTLTYPYRVLGHWLVIGDDAFFDFCRIQLKMPDAKAEELCEALAEKWHILAAHGSDYEQLSASPPDSADTSKQAKFLNASFISIDANVDKILPGVGEKMAAKWKDYLKTKPTSRLLLGHFLRKLSANDDYQRFLKFAVEKVGMQTRYAEELGEALLEKWQILRKV